MNKSVVREQYKSSFRSLTKEQLEIFNKNLFTQVIKSDEFKKSKNILFFYGSANEPDTKEIITEALLQGKKIALPFCTEKQGIMAFYEIKSLAQLSVGAYNIMEPNINICKEVNTSEFEICFIPGIFDKFGNRVGHGKGYYDRFLSSYNGIKAGLNFKCLLFDNIKSESHDIAMDILITDKGKLFCKQ